MAPWVRQIPGDRIIYYNLDDYALYDASPSAVVANLLAPAGNTGDAAGDSYLSIEATWSCECLIENVWTIGRSNHNNRRGLIEAVHLY